MIPWWWAPILITLGLSAGILGGIWLSGLTDEPPDEPIPEDDPPIVFPDWPRWNPGENPGNHY